jgi:8-amino-7-oxononanoate synthase
MPDLLDKYDAAIAERASLQLGDLPDPISVVMERVVSPTEAIIQGRKTILVGTYNYMGMTFHPEVIAAGQQALAEFGSGTTGSRILNGTYAGHKALEERLARFYGMNGCIVFSTGYQANLAMCSALATKGDYIIIDADSHASIYDGCSMGTADVVRFKHNDPDDLAKRLRRLPAEAGKLVVLEGVYSMLGDVGRLPELCAVAKEYGAMILDDEAHAMGFFGEHGRGVLEAQGVEDQIDFVVGTFSKSVGTIGGFAVSNHPKFEILRIMSRPYMFTASLPPSVVATATKAIELISTAQDKRERLWRNSRALHQGLREIGFQLGTPTAQSAIIAVLCPDQETTVKLWAALIQAGVYVNMARPPAEHTMEQVETILAAFQAAAQFAGYPLRSALAAE